jgi:hypothetical protein
MKQYLFLFLVGLISFSCDPDPAAPAITYPIVYKYKGLEYEKASFFVLESNGLQEITAKGKFVEYEPSMKELMEDFFSTEDNIKTIELTSDKDVKITLNDGSAEILQYVKNGDILTLTLDPTTKETIDLKNYAVTGSKPQVKIPTLCYLYSYKKNGKQEYSPFEISATQSTNLKNLANNIVTTEKLQLKDTIGINISQIVYE